MFASNGASLMAGIHAAQRLLNEYHLGEIADDDKRVNSARDYLRDTIFKLFDNPESARAFLDSAIQSAAEAIAAKRISPA